MSIARMLARVPLFDKLTDDQLQRLEAHITSRYYRENEPVFRRGEDGETLYIINSGRVKIHNISDDGHEIIIAYLPQGEFFGEMSLLDGEGRSADATVIEAGELLMLHRSDFIVCLSRYPQMVSHILSVLGKRIRNANAQLDSLAHHNVTARLARQIVILSQQHGVTTPEGVRIEARLTQQNLASLIGASRESVNKNMKYLRERRLITFRKGTIIVHSIKSLAKMYSI
ncbi:MAG: Crp/Fnr family transcriptional regulator [Armatimonadetes bacterium]|nr:Crp/Fnr family transcriptional regulator [Armatimonadota bacterium]